jgi:hypothetical protein
MFKNEKEENFSLFTKEKKHNEEEFDLEKSLLKA